MKLRLLAIDPGVRIGWAIANGGAFEGCGTCERIIDLPRAPFAVIEHPRIYPSVSKWGGDPQDIAKLAVTTGRIAQYCERFGFVEPIRWRGAAPEKVIRARTRDALRVGEHLPRSMSVHAWDALGILLWALGRFRRDR